MYAGAATALLALLFTLCASSSAIAGNRATVLAGPGSLLINTELAAPAAVAQMNGVNGGDGSVLITEQHRVVRVMPTGEIVPFAGSGEAGPAEPINPDTLALDITLNGPRGIAVAPSGVVFISDTGNHRVLKVAPDGRVLPVLGSGKAGSKIQGSCPALAELNEPVGLAVSPRDNSLLVADSKNNRVLKLFPYYLDASDQTVSVLAGGEGSRATLRSSNPGSVKLNGPEGVAVDDLTVYIADTLNHRVLKVTDGVLVEAFAGSCKGDLHFNPASSLLTDIQLPSGVLVLPDRSVLISARGHRQVFRARKNWAIEHYAGSGRAAGSEINWFSPLTTDLASPAGMALLKNGSVLVADGDNSRVVWISEQDSFQRRLDRLVWEGFNLSSKGKFAGHILSQKPAAFDPLSTVHYWQSLIALEALERSGAPENKWIGEYQLGVANENDPLDVTPLTARGRQVFPQAIGTWN